MTDFDGNTPLIPEAELGVQAVPIAVESGPEVPPAQVESVDIAARPEDDKDSTSSPAPTLTTRQRRAITALLVEKTQADVAINAGVSESTLRRWLADPFFQSELQAAERMLLDGVIRRLTGVASDAVTTLSEIMGNKEAGHWARIQAASALLSRLIELREVASLEERLSRLESQA